MANFRKIRGELQGGGSLSHFGRNVNPHREGGKQHGVSFKKKIRTTILSNHSFSRHTSKGISARENRANIHGH